MRRTLFIAAAVILALAGSAFAAASPCMDSPYRKLVQRVRVLATHTIDAPNGMAETLDWATLLKAGNTIDACDDSPFELTSHTIAYHESYSPLAEDENDRHVGIIPAKAEHRRVAGWWEPYEIQDEIEELPAQIDLWGRSAHESTVSRGRVHVV